MNIDGLLTVNDQLLSFIIRCGSPNLLIFSFLSFVKIKSTSMSIKMHLLQLQMRLSQVLWLHFTDL